jgi:hypothetical protein
VARGRADAVVDYGETDGLSISIGALAQQDLNIAGVRVLGCIGERLLDDAVDVGAGLGLEVRHASGRFDGIARASARALVVACDESLEAGDQAQVIDLLRPQISQRPAQRHHQSGSHVLELASLLDASGCLVLGAGSEARCMRAQRAQLLRNLVVQLAGDVTALVLLRVDEAPRQLGALGRRLAEILGECVEDLADAVELAQAEGRQAIGEVAASEEVQA